MITAYTKIYVDVGIPLPHTNAKHKISCRVHVSTGFTKPNFQSYSVSKNLRIIHLNSFVVAPVVKRQMSVCQVLYKMSSV